MVLFGFESRATAVFDKQIMHPAGAHPQNPVPVGRCGSFSFYGRNRPLLFIWTQQGHAHPTVAWIRSPLIGTAIITFHPATWGRMAVYVCYQYSIGRSAQYREPPSTVTCDTNPCKVVVGTCLVPFSHHSVDRHRLPDNHSGTGP